MRVTLGNFLFRHRNTLFPFACLLLLLPGRRLWGDPLVAAIVGGTVAASGQAIRALTIGLRYIVRGGRDGRVYADDLVTEGVYALCRNPMYVGNVLIVVGMSLGANSLTTVVAAVPLVLLAYAAIVAAEEQFLRGRFGTSYDRYCADVPRWLPRGSAIRQALVSGSYHWRRVIMKEYGTPFGWVNALCLVALFNLWRDGLLESQAQAAQALVAAMMLVTALWLFARIAKKTRLIVAD